MLAHVLLCLIEAEGEEEVEGDAGISGRRVCSHVMSCLSEVAVDSNPSRTLGGATDRLMTSSARRVLAGAVQITALRPLRI